MKSKKWKVINIKTPQMRQLRYNLRAILKLAIEDKIDKLSRLKKLYLYKPIELITPSQWKRETQLSRKSDELFSAYGKSILQCSNGLACDYTRKRDLLKVDMGWVPPFKQWFCAKCHYHSFNREEHRELARSIAQNPDKYC